MKVKVLSIVTLLLMAATGAVAQTETLLTTITADHNYGSRIQYQPCNVCECKLQH